MVSKRTIRELSHVILMVNVAMDRGPLLDSLQSVKSKTSLDLLLTSESFLWETPSLRVLNERAKNNEIN